MKYIIRICLILAVGLASSLAHASAPAVLTVKYKGEMLPVVKMIGSDPVVMVEGHSKRIRTKTHYQPQRGEHFSQQSVEVISASLDGTQAVGMEEYSAAALVRSETDGVTLYTRPEINITLKAPETVKGAFIVVGVREPNAKDRAFAKLSEDEKLIVRALPPLAAGVETPVQITSRDIRWVEPSRELAIMVFDAEGNQIRTNANHQS